MRAARAVVLVVGVLVLVAAAPAGAQTLRLSPGSLFEAPQSVGLEAMARAALRRAQQKQSLTSKLAEPSRQKPRVVCGMMIFSADPKIDAAIMHPVPNSDASKFTLQIVTPPACQRQEGR
jgi:hypothetical protein